MNSVVKTTLWALVLLALASCSSEEESLSVEAAADEAVASAPVQSAESELTESDSRPNIVFILVDDMGFKDVGFNNSEISTPTLDRIATEGVQLDRNYAYPICSPTRAALLSGQNPLAHGVDAPMSDKKNMPLDIKLMPEYFQDIGYETLMVGKWHLGLSNTDHWPIARGFDYHYGFLAGWTDFYSHVYAGGVDWQRNGVTVREEGHATDLMTDDAVRLINERDSGAPFFLYLSYNAPHSPLLHPPAETGLVNEEGADDRSVYSEMVTHMDQGIAEVVDAMDSTGLLENTIIVFSSDNGGSTRAGANNDPFRGQKGSTLEGGVRVPGAIWAPGLIDGGKLLEQPIVMTDWLPTLLDAVGSDPSMVENLEGQSMWAAIAEDQVIDHAPFVLGANSNRAAYDWPWKLVQINAEPGSADNIELYNIVEDPTEQNNLLEQEPERVSALVDILQAVPLAESVRSSDRNGSVSTWYFREDNGLYDYNLSINEVREPWAEAAIIGSE